MKQKYIRKNLGINAPRFFHHSHQRTDKNKQDQRRRDISHDCRKKLSAAEFQFAAVGYFIRCGGYPPDISDKDTYEKSAERHYYFIR